MDWLLEFPAMDTDRLTALKKTIDLGFPNFTRANGDMFEAALYPVQWFMYRVEQLLTGSPWPLVILGFAIIAWFASRSAKITVGVVITLLLIGYFDMWEDTMKTVAMTVVATILAIIVGIPIGILMGRSNRIQAVLNRFSM